MLNTDASFCCRLLLGSRAGLCSPGPRARPPSEATAPELAEMVEKSLGMHEDMEGFGVKPCFCSVSVSVDSRRVGSSTHLPLEK